MSKKRLRIFIKYAFIGILAGFVSGFFGAGGGVVLVFALCLMNKDTFGMKDAFAETALITATYSTVTAFVYYLKGSLDLKASRLYIIPALVGGFVGALLLDRIATKGLKKLFGAVVIIAGLIMIFR